MQDKHAQHSSGETKQTLPSDNLKRLNRRPLKHPFFKNKLRSSEDLSTSNEEHTDNGSSGIRQTLVIRSRGLAMGLLVRPDGTRKTNDSHTSDDANESKPLEQVKVSAEEDDRKQTDEENKSSTGHLVNRSSDEQQTSVHERCAEDITDSRQRKKRHSPPTQDRLLGRLGVLLLTISIKRVDSLVSSVGGGAVASGLAVEGHEGDDDPAAHFADEHLGSLQDGLVEEGALADLGGVAVSNALHVLDKQKVRIEGGS